ncbi:MAG: twin-arginine translocase subunit TatC [Gammaproteobacteria bacterium]|nr:MAG: twin-arginine translocase subunit TatC [Gammaproteobacteria bacterium]
MTNPKKHKKAQKKTTNNEQPFLSHLLELRDRILKVVVAIVVVFVVMFPFSEIIYSIMATPLLSSLPDNSKMQAIGVAAPFLIPLKMVLVGAVFITMPYSLYQVWSFIAPGLYLHEKKMVRPLIFSSTVLFYTGIAFAHFVVLPLAFNFFATINIEGVEYNADIGYYLDFILTIFFAFGIAFEVPIATVLLIATGATTAEKLAKKRPYVVVFAFIIGMMLTPPDIISQTLLALPMWFLFEMGLIVSKYFLKNKKNNNDDNDLSDEEQERELDQAEKEEL